MELLVELKYELMKVRDELNLNAASKGLEWWVHSDRANKLRNARGALEQVIKFLEEETNP